MRPDLVNVKLSTQGPIRGAAPGARDRTVKINLAESSLTWLHARGHLDDRLFAAGEKLRDDYERARLAPRVTMRWDPVRVSGSTQDALTPSERQVAAKQRFDQDMSCAGSGLQDILWRVVCAGDALPAAERQLAWPARSGKLVLRLALERVAGYYRIQ